MTSVKNVRHEEGEPFDYLTDVCERMVSFMEEQPDLPEGVKAIVFLDHEDRGGAVMHGFTEHEDDDENAAEAIAMMLRHVEAIAETMGLKLQVHTVGEG